MSAASEGGIAGGPEVIVIGAGIVGVSAALALQGAGARVTVLERSSGLGDTSSNNAGGFAFTEIQPLASPGIMAKAPRWLLDPLGPLAVPTAYALQITPWLLRFWRASQRDRHDASLDAQASLMRFARLALERQIGVIGGEDLMQREGQLQVFDSQAQFEASRPHWEAADRHGIGFTLLESREAIAEIQPGLDPRFTHGGFTPEWINTVDPAAWLARVAETFRARGGRIDRAEVLHLAEEGGRVRLHTRAGELSADHAVVAAGAWSHHLTRSLGDRPPLETERGYNTTLPPGAFDLRTQLTFASHGFVVSRIAGGIRVGGAVELGGLKLPPNFKRAKRMLDKAAAFMPTLKTDGGRQWMGFRPSLPDTLPVISPSSRTPRVVYAFGHGHLGLTQSAATGELVRDLVLRRPPPIDLAPFAVTRF